MKQPAENQKTTTCQSNHLESSAYSCIPAKAHALINGTEAEGLLNENGAARDLGVAVQTLRNWRHLRKGPAYICVGRRRLYDPADLKAFKRAHRVDPEAASV